VAGGGIVMWVLLHFTRMLTVLKRAADRPIGSCGQRRDAQRQAQGHDADARDRHDPVAGCAAEPKDEQPEVYRWTDGMSALPPSMADRDGKIWMDGQMVDWRDAKIHVLTHTLHYGCGAFEGVRAYNTVNGTAIFRLRSTPSACSTAPRSCA
jgi:hypothetical protein